MPYVLDFTIPHLPDLQAAAAKGHWRKRHAETKRWHDRVRAIVLGDHYLPDAPLERARVVYERHSANRCDPGNLPGSFKAIEDGLVRCGVLANDRAENYEGGAPVWRWVKAPRGEGHVRVRVEESTLEVGNAKPPGRYPLRGFGDMT